MATQEGESTTEVDESVEPYVEMVDPEELEISDLNERFGDLAISELVENVEKRGIIEPPVVRPEGGKLKVIIGQRRVFAALQANIDEIPVIVMDYDDVDALLASVTENTEAFRKEVHPNDRAKAIDNIKELTGWSYGRIGEEFGLSGTRISAWHEREREEWEGTSVAPDEEQETPQKSEVGVEENGDGTTEEDVGVETESFAGEDVEEDVGVETESFAGEDMRKSVDNLADEAVAEIRRVTGGGEEGEELAKKAASAGLSKTEVREVTKRIKQGEEADEAVEELRRQKETPRESKVRLDMTIGGEVGKTLQEFAEENHTTEEQVVRDAVEEYLGERGEL